MDVQEQPRFLAALCLQCFPSTAPRPRSIQSYRHNQQHSPLAFWSISRYDYISRDPSNPCSQGQSCSMIPAGFQEDDERIRWKWKIQESSSCCRAKRASTSTCSVSRPLLLLTHRREEKWHCKLLWIWMLHCWVNSPQSSKRKQKSQVSNYK